MTQSYDAIMQQIEEMKRKADEVKQAEKGEALDKVKEIVLKHGLELSDVAKLFKGATRSGKATGKVEPKYRDPATGNTWTGRGRMPGWLAAHVDSGRTKESYLIQG